jgi:hypothetical protein
MRMVYTIIHGLGIVRLSLEDTGSTPQKERSGEGRKVDGESGTKTTFIV